jgi:uncharacterized protein involved in response to NO
MISIRMNRASHSLRTLSEEPFRIFFPTGLFLGMTGVSLWLLFYFGAGIPYPGVSHARLMIEGFIASFLVGFLGTAGPRMLSASPFSVPEVGAIFTLDLLAAGFHTAEAHQIGDICFVACLVVFVCAGINRFRKRKDCPPPNFSLVLLGLLSGIAGAALVAYSENAQYSHSYQFGSALLNQGFILLPVLGISPFFLDRLLDRPLPDAPESRAFPPRWVRQAAFAGFVGLAVIGSFLIDTFNFPAVAGCVRLGAIAIYLAVRLPFRGRNFLASCLRSGVISILLGLAVAAFLPNYRVGALHIVFITGFSFMVFTVAIRVIFGHSGNAVLFQKRLPFLVINGLLLVITMLSRVTAEFSPRARIVHLVAAAVCWLLASLIWMAKVLPKVVVAEPDA